MSCGERSCAHGGKCPEPERDCITECNVDCPSYKWDGRTTPDSVPQKTHAESRLSPETRRRLGL